MGLVGARRKGSCLPDAEMRRMQAKTTRLRKVETRSIRPRTRERHRSFKCAHRCAQFYAGADRKPSPARRGSRLGCRDPAMSTFLIVPSEMFVHGGVEAGALPQGR